MNFSDQRKSMVENQLRARGIKDELVLKAMKKVPREEFLPEDQKVSAYGDFPVLIGLGQTISQPYVVAAMTEALKLKGGEKVLEIGTGAGYQSAILAEIVRKVYTVETVKELAGRSRKKLKALGYSNVKVIHGDGNYGCKKGFPFNCIIVTAACQKIPEQLQEQLKEGGKIVIPIGGRALQELFVFTKKGKEFKEEFLFDCRFVPLIGEAGWDY